MIARAQRAAGIAVATASLLAAGKAAAALVTGSLSIWASALDSLMDALSSGTNAMALRLSRREPTRVYAFGYGKIQSLAMLLQGLLITGSAGGLAWTAIRHLQEPRALQALDWGVATMAATAGVGILLTRYLRREAEQTSTPLLSADALHYSGDIWANAAALAGLLLGSWTGEHRLDALFSIAIAVWILKGALAIASRAVGELLDHGLPEEEIARVAEVVGRYAPEVKGFHDLRTRRSGHRRYFDFHVVMRPELTFARAHELTDRIIQDLEALWPGADVTVHPDPESDPRLPYAGQG